MVNLATVHSIMVHSNLSMANVLSTRSGNSTILQKISIDVNGYNIIYLNQDDYRTNTVTSQPVIDSINMKLTDQNNNLLNLNNLNYEMSVIFNIYPKYRDNRNIIAPAPTPIIPSNIQPITRIEPTIDDTHPIVGMSEIEHDTQKIILDTLLELQ